MQPRSLLVAAGAFAVLAGTTLGGCVDLFHGTDFAAVVAPRDASSDAASDAADVELCNASPAEALATATRSCAILAACESPVGDNAMGRCLPNAIVAYDCSASSLRPGAGEVRSYWACLARATSCGAVRACIYPQGVAACPSTGTFTTCPLASARADCEQGGQSPLSEACAATGRVCTKNGDSEAYCSGTAGLACTVGSSCEGTQLHACAVAGVITLPDGTKGTLDDGFDCAKLGAGECVHNAIGASCKPYGVDHAEAATCTPTSSVRCEGDVAIGCPSGFEERVSCSTLTAGRARACVPTKGGRTWDVSRACGVPATDGSTGTGCARDVCSGEKLVACVRGTPVEIDCATVSVDADRRFGRCIQVRTFDGERPTCSAP